MRLFVAIELPGNINEYLQKLQKRIDTSCGKFTLTRDIHLTLKFLGDVPECRVDNIKKELASIRFISIKLELSDMGIFPNRKYAKVIWVGLKEDPEINKLQIDIDNKMQNLGFSRDRRFHPHLTLVRVKFISNEEQFWKNIDSIKTENKRFEANEFALFKSTLTSQGPIYEKMMVYTCE
jgi:RNA 2',3'-cyclic 3'-phosphodiesterase